PAFLFLSFPGFREEPFFCGRNAGRHLHAVLDLASNALTHPAQRLLKTHRSQADRPMFHGGRNKPFLPNP
ncbi:MAG: hypothetical protein VW877_14630, partial [Pseudomonadaceae bacterium]